MQTSPVMARSCSSNPAASNASDEAERGMAFPYNDSHHYLRPVGPLQ